ncbi:MAG: DUF262 domain-containing protein [Lachnospiraceae bacterium]|nr:DUF262 domain-containing protein [Lachnospiraceae bacterium]
MKINHTRIKVRDIVDGYTDNQQTGQVSGMNGKLDIRPAYQREFVYKDKQRDSVLETIQKGFPLNVIYWAKTGADTFEVLDGQQRTISICQYCNDEFSIDFRYFHNLTPEEKDVILDYELDVYQCEGTDKEKLDWFQIINIAGEKLTNQELRNAVYAGTWLSDAKKRFSARNCAAERLAKDYLTGSAIRQDYLETAISWIAAKENTTIEDYMAKHQNDSNAGALWSYFSSVIEWVKSVFPEYRKEMKGVEWGLLFNEFGTQFPDVATTEAEVKRLMMDEDVTAKKGIYEYILSGREKTLSIRAFTPNQKREAYERQNHKCPYCEAEGVDKEWKIDEMEADHITPWHSGGRTISENCKMLCKSHNRQKGGI